MPEPAADPVFVALSLPNVARSELAELSAGLRFSARDKQPRFVDPDNYHVTLRFLGNIAPSLLDTVVSRIKDAARDRLAPTCGYLGCAGLPRRSRAHVFVATLSDPNGQLVALYQALSDALLEAGFPSEKRPFHPHVTLARFKKATDVRTLVAVARVPQQPWTPNAVVLFRSERRRSGVRYLPLFEQRLDSVE